MIFAFVTFSALAQTADIQYSGLVVQVDLAAHQVVVKDPQVDIGYVQSGDQYIANTITLQPTGG
jgi:hypothetical protein